MGRANKFITPQIDDIIDSLATAKGWTGAQKAEGKQWYEHFLEANWKSPGTEINVLNRTADEVWHAHILNTQRYTNYCNACFGYYLDHFPDQAPQPPTAAQLAAVQPAYQPHWPVPDSIVSCHS